MKLEAAVRTARAIAQRHDGLRLLLLHGSRARRDAHAASDWDFAYLGTPPLDPLALFADLSEALETNDIDLADLEAATGLLRFRAAHDGILVFESSPGIYEEFAVQAARFWYDAGPVIREAQRAFLERLG